jgi:hypothetical protein
VSADGGEEIRLVDGLPPNVSWTVGKQGIYFFSHEFASGKTRKILTIDRPASGPMAISPDYRTILYQQLDEAGSDLMLAENFR